MAQEVVEVDSVEETLTIVDQSQSQSSSSSSSSSPSSSDPSPNNVILSRNPSFSKLNAQAPEFVPTRPQTQPSLTVIPPPSPPAPAPMTQQHPHHLYSPSPSPPSPSPFHVPIHSPVPVPHMIPVHHHPHPHPPHQHHHPHHHPHHHHLPHQQYVPVRNHNNGGGNSTTAHYVPVQQQQSTKKIQSSSSSSEEEVVNHAVPASNHKKDRTGSSDHHSSSKNDKNGLSDEAAMQKLINQVEYYFSDINLATTDHLMRFINKDPEGYVPISVVSSFKKVKAAISGNSQLAAILRNSSKLIVSEDGKKVKRQQPLTESDVEELQSRIVVAENLPEDHCHQNLMKIFSSVGSVKTIRTCPPQASGGSASSASRSGKADGMHFSNKLHAFVEYESVEIAEKAVAELNEEGNWRSGLRVRLMLKRTSKPTQARGKKGHDGQGHSEEDEVSVAEQQQNEKQMEDPSLQYDMHSYEHLGEDNGNEKEGAHRKGRGRGKGKGRGRAQYHNSNRGNQVGAPPSNNPVNNEQGIMVKQPPGPRMPDGTRGFAMGRGKPIVPNTT